MVPDEPVAALVAPLRADVVSGATAVARKAADILRRAAVRVPGGSVEELRWGLGDVAIEVLDAQPAMAPLVSLVRDVLEALERADSVEGGRHAAVAAAERFRTDVDERAAAVAAHAARILPSTGAVATTSASSAVKAALIHGATDPARSVVCFESRPRFEGRALAAALADAGIPVTLAVDAAADSLVPSCEAVLLGADSVGDRGVVNKIGSVSLARAAQLSDVPVYVLASEPKILPHGFPQPLDDDRDPGEVWAAPAGVTVRNRYFEALPFEYVTAFVGESGALSPAELEETRSLIGFPPFLRRWAEGR